VMFRRAAGAADISGTATYQLSSLVTLNIYAENNERYKTNSSGTVAVQ